MDRIITVNGASRPWTARTVRALLRETGVEPDRGGVAVAVNGAVVPRAAWESTTVQPDDKVEIVHIVRGG
jgi:sulfur carrier protein